MATPAAHKPRRRRKEDEVSDFQPRAGSLITEPVTRSNRPAFPLEAFLWPAQQVTSQWIILPLILMFAGLYRWAAGFWGYSGFQTPPMHGDFEAQRHWMEITTHLPVSQWYFHDLQWWGLDYPPLTAYHSWLLGKLGAMIDPSWFALYKSRGLDDPFLKVYMRATVVASEYALYMPAIILFCHQFSRLQHVNQWTFSVALAAILMQPATILIDHAHFQYNTVMLGFVAATMAGMLRRSLLWSCVFFVAALGFKQMALYFAPVVFAYLLGSCVFPQPNIGRLLAIALITATSFAVLFLPLVLGTLYDTYNGILVEHESLPPMLQSLNISNTTIYFPILVQLTQSIHRVFPFARGLFEDKVANVWCAIHTFHKLNRHPIHLLQRISLGATLASITPACLMAFFYPQRNIIPAAFASTAWGFFLFSFQVHEKSVLLPLLPMTLLLSGEAGLRPRDRSWIVWANVLGCWTMYPLLKRDELRVPYFILTLLWAWLMGVPEMLFWSFRSISASMWDRLGNLVHLGFYTVMIIWHILEAFVETPVGKPDLWVVINVLIGAPGFGLCYLWCLWKVWDGLGWRQRSESAKPKRN